MVRFMSSCAKMVVVRGDRHGCKVLILVAHAEWDSRLKGSCRNMFITRLVRARRHRANDTSVAKFFLKISPLKQMSFYFM